MSGMLPCAAADGDIGLGDMVPGVALPFVHPPKLFLFASSPWLAGCTSVVTSAPLVLLAVVRSCCWS